MVHSADELIPELFQEAKVPLAANIDNIRITTSHQYCPALTVAVVVESPRYRIREWYGSIVTVVTVTYQIIRDNWSSSLQVMVRRDTD